MKKTFVGATVAASAIGGMAGAIAFTPGVSGAQDDTTPEETVPTEETVPAEGVEDGDALADRTEALREKLDALVEDGTITSDQADAVADHLATEAGFRRGRGHGGSRSLAGADQIAETLGLTSEEVAEAIRGGQTIAELAEANGVDVQVIIDQIVASAQERVDASVEAGRIDADRAAEIIENTETRAEAAVNGEASFGNRRGRGFGRADQADSSVEQGSVEPANNTPAA